MLARLRVVALTVAVVAVSALLAGCVNGVKPPPPLRDPVAWIIGTWEGKQDVPFGEANVRIVFEKKDGQMHWKREYLTGPFVGANSARASGSAAISGDQVKLTGTYDPNQRFSGAVEMSLTRSGDGSLTGIAIGRDGIRNKITLRKPG